VKTSTIQKAWYDYLNSVLPEEVTVVFAEELENEGGPRPQKPYVTLKLISGPRHLTLDDEIRFSGNNAALVGQRAYTLSVQSFGADHIDYLNDISTYLDDPNKFSKLKSDADIAVTNRGAVLDISQQIGTAFERRASLDIIFNSSNNKPIDIEVIENVSISGTLTTQDGKEKTVNVPDIEKE